jgi:SAM-dependent methyltransferase
VTVDLGTGDGRAVLARASAHPDELVLGIDASSAGMVRASRRAAASMARGGMPNARFLVSGLALLPAELCAFAALVTIHFPWGSLLAAAVGHSPAMTARIVRLLRPGGRLLLLLSASPRDERGGLSGLDTEAVAAVYRRLGMRLVVCRAASHADLVAASSSWGKRLAASQGRTAWLIDLVRPPSPADRA